MCFNVIYLRKNEVNNMVERTEYLEKIKAWREEDVIKVVTGIRRC